MIKVLVVEDNSALLADMIFHLKVAGFEAHGVGSGSEMDQLLSQGAFDILLLDLGLPDESGFEITHRVKDSLPGMGIIIITAESQLSSRILGHKTGADHYLTKPVNYPEVSAIIETLFNRIKPLKALKDSSSWKLDSKNMRLISPMSSEAMVELTWSELQVLKVFEQGGHNEASKEDLIAALNYDVDSYDIRRLETIISRLRKKVSSTTDYDEPLIKALRNVGYQFLEDIELI